MSGNMYNRWRPYFLAGFLLVLIIIVKNDVRFGFRVSFGFDTQPAEIPVYLFKKT